METQINEKMKSAMKKMIDDELASLKVFENTLPKDEYERICMMIPVVAKGAFLEGFKTGCEILGVNFDKTT